MSLVGELALLFAEVEDEFDLAYGVVELLGDVHVGEARVGELGDLGLDGFDWGFDWCFGGGGDWSLGTSFVGDVVCVGFWLRVLGFDSADDSGLAVLEVLLDAGAIEERGVDHARWWG